MNTVLKIQQKLLPDLLEVMQHRYQILKYIRLMEPIGRRILATHLGMTERVLRAEILFLKEQGLVNVSSAGMSLTPEGRQLIRSLESVMKEVSGLKELELQLRAILNIEEVIIVAGDSDENELVKKEMGRACASRMKKAFATDNIIAITGGSTVAAVAEMLTPTVDERNTMFFPARGGLGENVQSQANTIVAKMAEKTMGQYKLLHVPDQVSDDVYSSLVEEPAIKETLEMIQQCSMVVHGIGDAITMAKRRKTDAETIQKISDGQAVGEAFGYYFDADGNVVHKVRTIGLQLENLENVPCIIAVAGGASKAKAIAAVVKQRQGRKTILVTDEGAANELVRLK
ncbi:transcriptional regulator [Schinkia azotoformans MEV2011]|uniref:Transcriptional regulator n=1 Tax=Schinkia azotoformans MEV2011 TaxID=1348973 RepID=A0A072NSQ2_SCHAZ|nr:sugar-binding domain-containing protein [Schinkia azotoformans]KEF40252.1 transcriptional regulator [Schinkia azotoformans MEV2011]MEC1696440.1 sugar-binding domain-containing protein [Schinkia azotoformans]MEC1724111.1 sugar-binding domain-containing protein [Schinkia azotoformans]MEC1760019.1 sugar-binding domain-containing protein [Schinkia azotoformans]MEC1770170.1 sugar-binding domain-containing protein [Schinkia azotoformans]